MIEIECVVDAKSDLGEATYWDPKEQVLWWIDIYGSTIHCTDPSTQATFPPAGRPLLRSMWLLYGIRLAA